MTSTPSKKGAKSGVRGFGIFILVAGFTSLAIFGGVYALRRKRLAAASVNSIQYQNENIAPSSDASAYNDHVRSPDVVLLDLGPNQDLDGNVLHNVDII
jgi:hypothetical protein